MTFQNDSNSELTSEDKLLLELLADGELSESERQELLVRLDQIRDGWRFCAIAFLESQCLHETFTAQRLPSYTASTRTILPAVTVQDSPIEGSSALKCAREEAPVAKEHHPTSSDPLIIPMKQGSRFVKKRHSSGGSDGSGPTWHHLFQAMAGGFLLAVFLSGILVLIISEQRSVKPNSGEIVESTTPIGTEETPQIASNVEKKMEAGEESNLVSLSEPPNTPVQLVTIRSPKPSLNGLTVPCIDSEEYDPEDLREMRLNAPNAHFEKLRQAGYHIDTLYEDIIFPLHDGRTLILPVDTYHVHYNKTRDYQ